MDGGMMKFLKDRINGHVILSLSGQKYITSTRKYRFFILGVTERASCPCKLPWYNWRYITHILQLNYLNWRK